MKLRLDIDELKLDEEWIGQPKQVFHFAAVSADAQAAVDEAKARLERVRCELSHEIRKDFQAYGLPKLTESSLEETVVIQPIYQKAVERLREARHDLARADAAVVALDHRKRALTSLVSLHGQEYFAAPRAAGGEDLEKSAVRRKRGRKDE